jgi:hypothetical protein
MGDVIECYRRLSTAESGIISLAVDVTFPASPDAGEGDEGSSRFWSGDSSTLPHAESVVACVRSRIETLPLSGIQHEWQRYSVFFPISFTTEPGAGDPESVELLLDRVRLRERPVDGKIIARLKRGEPLRILQTDDGWVKVRTADRREGWIYSDAITLPEQ